ncbi:hypothetical protein WJX84_004990 [Apatococcus fuscideae]|uniref:carnosine N-methyltransferase n=1 Tax=Apatococcus fuscideae TaxID=2026836 RepID=A0AAW1SJ50_9CHLO
MTDRPTDVHGHVESETTEEREEREEREALERIISAYRNYKFDTDHEVARWEHNYRRLPAEHRRLLPGQPEKFKRTRQCIEVNMFLIKSLLMSLDTEESMPLTSHPASQNGAGTRTSTADIDKVRYVLKNLMRDWGAEGAAERSQSYGRIVAELRKRLLPPGSSPTLQHPPRVLVPGAGLGRLCVDIASVGCEAQGNEFSYFMLLASSFIMNQASQKEQWTIHPWLHQSCNQLSDAHQLRAVRIPDVCIPDMLPAPGLLSMVAGDFAEVYSRPDQAGTFDAVVTCFFLDTAHNLIEYMQVLRHVLKAGGLWINLGPLLYHWADSHLYLPDDELSIEVSLEDVEHIAAELGFITEHREMVTAAYAANLKSMLHSTYRCVFWTMRKGP